MRRCIVIVVLLIFLFVASASEASDLFGTIRYRGNLLGNAKIVLKAGNRTVASRTRGSGYYSIRRLTPGNYTMIITLPDRSTRSVEVYVFPQNTERNLNIE